MAARAPGAFRERTPYVWEDLRGRWSANGIGRGRRADRECFPGLDWAFHQDCGRRRGVERERLDERRSRFDELDDVIRVVVVENP
jgi:hypothetical protein